MLRDALERKKALVLLLASTQSDVETHSSFLVEEQGLEETVQFYNAHYNIGDYHTAVGRFTKTISSVTFRTCPSSLVKSPCPVGCIISC